VTCGDCSSQPIRFPSKLFVTFLDSDGECPCLNGLEFELNSMPVSARLPQPTDGSVIHGFWRFRPSYGIYGYYDNNCKDNEDTILCDGNTAFYYPACQYAYSNGPQLTLSQNPIGVCNFNFFWSLTFDQFVLNDKRIIANAASDGAIFPSESTTVFPCQSPFFLEFTYLYFSNTNQYDSDPFACFESNIPPYRTSLRKFKVTITE
jgi:hypothetical protein